MLKKILLASIIGIFGLGNPILAFATEYWVAATLVSIGDGLTSAEPMSYNDFSAATFQPGDVINFMSDFGPFPNTLYFIGNKVSGNEGNPITIRGDGNTIVDVSCCGSRSGIYVVAANHLILEGLSVIGSGGAAAIVFSRSGNADQGYTVTGVDLEVIANNANDLGNHDGIAVNNDSEIYLIRPVTRGTRPLDGSRGSHQSITAHVNGHAVVEDADFADTNSWAVPVDTSSITFYGGTFTDSHVGSFNVSGSGSAASFVKVQQTDAHPVYIEIGNASGPKSNSTVSNLASVEIDGGEMYIVGDSLLAQTTNRGQVVIKNMDVIAIDSDAWRYYGKPGSSLTMADNSIQLVKANQYFFRTEAGASLHVERNVISNSAEEIFIYSRTGYGDQIDVVANDFTQIGPAERLILLDAYNQGNVRIHQNDFADGNRAIQLTEHYPMAQITNNNFKNIAVTDVGDELNLLSHNNFDNSPVAGDAATSFDSADRSSLMNIGYTWWEFAESPVGIDGVAFNTPANIGPYAASSWLHLEAESAYASGYFVRLSDASASLREYVSVPDGTGNGSSSHPKSNGSWLDFEFLVPSTGVYKLRGRARGLDGGSDSFWIMPGNGAARVTWDVPISTSFVEEDVQDRYSNDPAEMYLQAGPHTVRVYLREDGSDLDWLQLIELQDSDNDGVSDSLDACPFDANDSVDTDMDELCDNADPYPEDPLNSGIVRIEAEDAVHSGNFQILPDPLAGQGAYSTVPNGAGNGSSSNPKSNSSWLDFEFLVPVSGVYKLSGSARGLDSGSDSFWVMPGNGAPRVIWDLPRSTSFAEEDVQDRYSDDPVEMQLQAGLHTIRVYLREDGSQLDWLQLTPQ